ncbi:DUF2637 domain-containing protein [Streptomyces chumphonensis]|uniref:DUF2637 domain-containing protein n=1 Tax=Streptomyces chumphonensis TaxID=1214925 RepID=UPI001CD0C046|nr:DUF2637 domain-containing protein [Streptomyces chumphonensis]
MTTAQRIAAAGVALAALTLALTGLYLSFNNVATFAHERLRFHSVDDGRMFIGGVDLGILTLIAVDLLLAWLRRPVMWIRYPVWLLTGATMALNSASAAPEGKWQLLDYVAVGAHGVVPVLFIVVVEIGRYVIDQVVRPDQVRTSIPLVRWLLAPWPTAKIYRQMRLRSLSYDEMVQREADLRGYMLWLTRICEAEDREPTADELLPQTLAPHGYTVAQALELPVKQAREADARAAELAAREREAKVARCEEEAAAKVREAEAQKRIRIANIQAQAEVEEAERAAEDQRTAAERAAAHLADLEETAEMREAQGRAARAEAERLESEAESERHQAEAARLREQRLVSEARAEAAERQKAEDAAAAARAAVEAEENRSRAAQLREAAVAAEQRAVELEDWAKLTPAERAVRRVMRMVASEAGGEPERLPLSRIAQEFNVSVSTAGNYRSEAAGRLRAGQDGYGRPELHPVA